MLRGKKFEGKKRLTHNREPWWRAYGPARTARQIAIAFLKYDVAPWMRSSAFPPLPKNKQLKPRYMHCPQEFFFVLSYFFPGVRIDTQTCFLLLRRRNLLFEPTAELLFFDCRLVATPA